MRLCRFNDNRLGVVEGAIIKDVTSALEVIPHYRYPLPTHDVLVQPDGKVVVGGQDYRWMPSGYQLMLFQLTRFNADGSLDSSFGIGGTVTTAINMTENDPYNK